LQSYAKDGPESPGLRIGVPMKMGAGAGTPPSLTQTGERAVTINTSDNT